MGLLFSAAPCIYTTQEPVRSEGGNSAAAVSAECLSLLQLNDFLLDMRKNRRNLYFIKYF